jgi:sugar/nucleoside kinase (ribokinase family)
MQENKILCVGHVNWDIVLHTASVPEPDHSENITEEYKSSGGSATNTGLVLSNLGENVALAGSIGNDSYGDEIQSVLRENDVTQYLHYSDDFGTTVIRAIITDDSDPRYFARNPELAEFSPNSVVDSWDSISHLHITSFSEDISNRFIEAVKNRDITVSFNPSQGYGSQEFPHIVDSADVIFVNEREAEMFRQRYNFGEVVENDTIIVVTHGAVGCTAYAPDGVVTHSGFSNDTVADTVGAGDAFVAGFLTEWEKQAARDEIEDALGKANACGASAVETVGAPDSVNPQKFLDE